MELSTTLALIAIIAAAGLIGVVTIDIVTPLEHVEAKGCPIDGPTGNASKTC